MEKYEAYRKLNMHPNVHETELSAQILGRNNKKIVDFKKDRMRKLLDYAKKVIDKLDKENLSPEEEAYIQSYEVCEEAFASNDIVGMVDYHVRMKFIEKLRIIIGQINSHTALEHRNGGVLKQEDIINAHNLVKTKVADIFTKDDEKDRLKDLLKDMRDVIEAYSYVSDFEKREQVAKELQRHEELNDKKLYYEKIPGRMEEYVKSVLGPDFDPIERQGDRALYVIKRDRQKNEYLKKSGIRNPEYQSFRWGMNIAENPQLVMSTQSVFEENIYVVDYGRFGYGMLFHEPELVLQNDKYVVDYGKSTYSSQADANIYGVTKVDKFGKKHTDFILSKINAREMQEIEERTSSQNGKVRGGFISNIYLSDYIINNVVAHNGSYMGVIVSNKEKTGLNITFEEVMMEDSITAARYAEKIPGTVVRSRKGSKERYALTLTEGYNYLRKLQDKILDSKISGQPDGR